MRAMILVCGIPGSGKTTMAGALADRLRRDTVFESVKVHSFDDYLVDQARIKNSEVASTSAKTHRIGWESMIAGDISPENKVCWIADDIFYLKSQRRSFAKIARAKGIKFAAIFVDCEIDEAIRRHATRPRRPQLVFDVTEQDIRRLAGAFENGEDLLHFNAAQTTIDQLATQVLNLLNSLPAPKLPSEVKEHSPNDRKVQETSRQKLDRFLRNAVTNLTLQLGSEHGATLNVMRRQVFAELKSSKQETWPCEQELENCILARILNK